MSNNKGNNWWDTYLALTPESKQEIKDEAARYAAECDAARQAAIATVETPASQVAVLPVTTAPMTVNVGRRLQAMVGPAAWSAIERPEENRLVVKATWITAESYESDPESIICKCPFQGQNHAHCQMEFTDLDTAIAAYTSVRDQQSRRLPVTTLGQINYI